uniref:Uncharacterized protein n=1 Tax=mine drainage metagenome TaxID=410659 RepID=E6QF52_9ZZZZ
MRVTSNTISDGHYGARWAFPTIGGSGYVLVWTNACLLMKLSEFGEIKVMHMFSGMLADLSLMMPFVQPCLPATSLVQKKL